MSHFVCLEGAKKTVSHGVTSAEHLSGSGAIRSDASVVVPTPSDDQPFSAT